MDVTLNSKTKVATCKNYNCIYWAGDKCMLNEVILGTQGMCKSCIYCKSIFGISRKSLLKPKKKKQK